MIKGLILSRQWQDGKEGQDLVFWLASETGPLKVEVTGQESIFFIDTANLDAARQLLGQQLQWICGPNGR